MKILNFGLIPFSNYIIVIKLPIINIKTYNSDNNIYGNEKDIKRNSFYKNNENGSTINFYKMSEKIDVEKGIENGIYI